MIVDLLKIEILIKSVAYYILACLLLSAINVVFSIIEIFITVAKFRLPRWLSFFVIMILGRVFKCKKIKVIKKLEQSFFDLKAQFLHRVFSLTEKLQVEIDKENVQSKSIARCQEEPKSGLTNFIETDEISEDDLSTISASMTHPARVNQNNLNANGQQNQDAARTINSSAMEEVAMGIRLIALTTIIKNKDKMTPEAEEKDVFVDIFNRLCGSILASINLACGLVTMLHLLNVIDADIFKEE